jgi:hypothetical protein
MIIIDYLLEPETAEDVPFSSFNASIKDNTTHHKLHERVLLTFHACGHEKLQAHQAVAINTDRHLHRH